MILAKRPRSDADELSLQVDSSMSLPKYHWANGEFLGWSWSHSALTKHIWSLFRWQFILAQNILQKPFFLLNKWGNLNGSNWLCRPWRHLVTALIDKTFEHVGVPNVRNFTALLSIKKKELPDVQIFTALLSMTAAPTYYCDVIDFLETCRNWHRRRYFTSPSRGIGIQFSTSNNTTTSLYDHWLVYRHCAKLATSLSTRFDLNWPRNNGKEWNHIFSMTDNKMLNIINDFTAKNCIINGKEQNILQTTFF